ncbi:sensor histidine kinase [Halalkalibacter urbisdiaboli]|uniref:sensor histidine kinase n=1 Tax=Halalkalibacter urbisdiaboli TaxID=1960589 RepID=UPI000B4308F3|nr:sensor histidine kinase [Halalkalibacter urbisdiaboli]
MHWLRKKCYEISQLLSFRTKLIIIIVVCLALPMMFSMGNIIYTSSNVVKNQTIKSEEYNVELANVYLKRTVDTIIQTMNYIHFDEQITSVLNEGLHQSIPPRAFLDINSKLNHLTRNSNIKISIHPVNKNKYFANQQYRGEYENEKVNDLANIMDNTYAFQVYWFNALDLIKGRTEGQQVNQHDQIILIGRRMTNYNGQTTAHMFAGIDKFGVDEILSSVVAGVEREMILLDEKGTILYDENVENIGQSFRYFEEMKEGKTATFINQDGDNYLCVYKKLSYANWTLVSFMPYQKAVDELGKTYTVNLYIVVIALIFLVFVLLYSVTKYTQPIDKLARVAKEIETGNLQIRSNIRRNDEIGRLGLAFDLMLDRIEEMIRQITTEQRMKRKAEMAVLQARIKPHFIFNVLNTIRIQMVKKGDLDNSRLITSFTKFLRSVYKDDEFITLQEEVEYTINYLNLVNSMRQHPIDIQLNLMPETLTVMVPRFFLQPIVENTCKHGLRNQHGIVFIDSFVDADNIVISISDNGIGMNRDELQRLKNNVFENEGDTNNDNGKFGIGIKNVVDRMKLIYGEDLKMSLEGELNKGMKIVFSVLEKGREDHHEGNSR